jgi:hypothetical protein
LILPLSWLINTVLAHMYLSFRNFYFKVLRKQGISINA